MADVKSISRDPLNGAYLHTLATALTGGVNFVSSVVQKIGSSLGLYVIPGSKQDIEIAERKLVQAVRLKDKPQAQKEYAKAMILFALSQDKPFYPSYEFAKLNFQISELNRKLLTAMEHSQAVDGSAKKNRHFMSFHEWRAAVKQAALELGQETYLNFGLELQSALERIVHLAGTYAHPKASKKHKLAEQKEFCERVIADSTVLKDNPELNTKLAQLIQEKLTPRTGIMFRGLQLLGTAVVIGAAYDGFHYRTAGEMPIYSYSKDLLERLQADPNYQHVANQVTEAVGKLQAYYQESDHYARLREVVRSWIQPMCDPCQKEPINGFVAQFNTGSLAA